MTFDKKLLYVGPVKYEMSPDFIQYIAWSSPDYIKQYDGEVNAIPLDEVTTNGEILSKIGPRNIFSSEEVLQVILSLSYMRYEESDVENILQENVCYILFAQDYTRKIMFIVTLKRVNQDLWRLGYETEAHLAWEKGVFVITKN